MRRIARTKYEVDGYFECRVEVSKEFTPKYSLFVSTLGTTSNCKAFCPRSKLQVTLVLS